MTPSNTETIDYAPYFRSREIGLPADAELMRRAHEFRFQVYCLECGFLTPENYPDQQESDKYDRDAAHFCASDRSGAIAGYVRLVRATPEQSFPFRSHCTALLDGITLPPDSECAEISRLMVSQHYRRRQGDILAGLTVTENSVAARQERRNNSPQILLSLYRQMYIYSINNGIRYWYAAMERSLARALTRMNFAFNQVGPQTDYYGPVAPYMADLRELETRVGASDPALLAWMRSTEEIRI